MDTIYQTSATSVGGREGHVASADGLLDLELQRPAAMGGTGEGTNPETLFAAGYSACFCSALEMTARLRKIRPEGLRVTATVSLNKSEDMTYELAVKIEAQMPFTDHQTATELMEQAHHVCPYSKATRGNIKVELQVTANK